MPAQTYYDPQTRFNAGVDVALTVSQIIKNCELFARIQNFSAWYNELGILKRRLMSKALRSKSKDGQKEIETASQDKKNLLAKYEKKIVKGKKIPRDLLNQLHDYLSSYEIVLRKYVDVYGLGMPDQEDNTFAILQRG